MEDRKEWKTGEKSDIEIRNLSVSFQDGGETVHAMEGVNAYFPAGSVTGLIGESGSADIITLASMATILPVYFLTSTSFMARGAYVLMSLERPLIPIRVLF